MTDNSEAKNVEQTELHSEDSQKDTESARNSNGKNDKPGLKKVEPEPEPENNDAHLLTGPSRKQLVQAKGRTQEILVSKIKVKRNHPLRHTHARSRIFDEAWSRSVNSNRSMYDATGSSITT